MKEQEASPTKPTTRKTRKGFTGHVINLFVAAVILLPLSGLTLFLYYSTHLPNFRPLKEQHLNAYSIVYSEDDELIGKFLMENRIPIPYDRIPKPLALAFVAAEDSDFFQHRGIDYRGIVRAMFKNMIAGRIVQGGSTITQQVTKTFFLTPKRSFLRKLKEVAYAFGLERTLTKEEILSLYMNNVYLGNGAYGVAAAADSYFNKRTEQLNLAEMAMIAGLVKAPSRYSPVNNLKRAKERQTYVLSRMAEVGFITQEQKQKALQTPLNIQTRESAYFSKAPYFTEFIRRQMEKKYGKEALYQEGLRIYTSLDLSFQRAAQRAVEAGVRDLDKRQGFRGPIRTLSEHELTSLLKRKTISNPLSPNEIVEGVILSKDDTKKLFGVWAEDRKGVLSYSDAAWALNVKPTPNFKPAKTKDPSTLLKPGDVVYVKVKDASKKDQPVIFSLEQQPAVQAALLCIDPQTGYVKAMVGGRDFGDSQFNRATQARRQPGSAFKPFIYSAAIEKGYTPSTVLMDSPVEYSDPDGANYWAPKNYDKTFQGPITFRNALAYSRNVVTVKILQNLGISYVLKFLKKMGIESPVHRDLSIALGTSEVAMPEFTAAFAAFANGGERVKPIFIKKVVTMKGEVLEEDFPAVEFEEPNEKEEEGEDDGEISHPAPAPPPPLRERVISSQNAYIMTHLLEGVVQHGTGQGAKSLGRPVAGKTGTSSDYGDAWFVGYTPSVLASVWVGFDDKRSLGQNETGARAALPIWVSFMSQALRNTPVESFRVPAGVTFVRVNLETGLPSSGGSEQTVMEAFADGTAPGEKPPPEEPSGSAASADEKPSSPRDEGP